MAQHGSGLMNRQLFPALKLFLASTRIHFGMSFAQ